MAETNHIKLTFAAELAPDIESAVQRVLLSVQNVK